MVTLKDVKTALNPDSASLKDGVFTIRRGFFYRHGGTAEALAATVTSSFADVTIVDCGEVWKPFRGGASVSQQSHWFVKFTIGAGGVR